MDLSPWQQQYLETVAPVAGADLQDVRTVVAAMAFRAATDEQLVEAFVRISDGSPNVGATLFGLGLAVGHAAEADVRSGAAVIDLRPVMPVVNPLSSAPAGRPAVGTDFIPNQRTSTAALAV